MGVTALHLVPTRAAPAKGPCQTEARMTRYGRMIIALGLSLCACSSSDDEPASGSLQAPMLMEVVPMEGVLHIKWMNEQKDCDSVEGERDMGAGYEAAFSVPGTVDNKMDGEATHDMTYSYRLRCKKGESFSVYSNEMSGNPTD